MLFKRLSSFMVLLVLIIFTGACGSPPLTTTVEVTGGKIEGVEQRERNRQDRTLGQARAQFDVVHAHACYDGEVDTSLEDVQICARRILDGMANQPVPQAFMRLHARYQELPR